MTAPIDVLVIGGGPGGAATAALAAAAGARVVLVERERFPRDKVCGEFVSAEGCQVLHRLGVLEQIAGSAATWVDSCRLTDVRGAQLDADLPVVEGCGRRGLGVSRARMDALLLQLAAERGVEVRQRWEGVEPMMDEGLVRGYRLRPVGSDSAGQLMRCGVVVAADGRRSRLARTLHPELCDPAKSRPGSWFGLKTHLRSGAGRLAGRIELHLFQGGYAGIGEVEDDRLNLCLLVSVRALRACGGSADRVLAERVLANPAARRSLGGLSRCGTWKAVGPLRFGPRRGSAAGALFVGDSAGTIDPFCGEGISNALRGAELALPFALEGAQRGGIDNALARGYDAAWRGEFGSVTRRARGLGRLFESPRAAAAVLWLLRGVGRKLVPRLVASTRTGCAMAS